MLRHVKFAHLPVSDLDRAIRFYVDRVGLALETDAPYPGWRWVELAIPGAATKLLLTQRANDAPSAEPDMILVADDVAAEYERLKANGVIFTQEPKRTEWAEGESYALFRDSENNLIMLGDG
jgi:predicted enzyme related to lactoylglutathione lyase